MEQIGERKSIRLMLAGRVQGVGFRYFVLTIAREMKIRGWIRNRSDGRVEIVAEGPEERLHQFVDKVKGGTPFSRIHKVDIEKNVSHEPFSSFEIHADV